MMAADGWTDVQRVVLGKSLAGGSATGPVFEGVTAEAIPFRREAFSVEAGPAELSVTLAGPWDFYAEFRRAHGLGHLPHPEPPEMALQAGTSLVIPLWLRNPTGASREVTLSADLPAGWTVSNGTGKFVVAAKQTSPARIEVNLPAFTDPKKMKEDARDVTVRAESNGASVGVVKLRVELRKRALPE
jgi:hypothetical protein